MVLTIGSEAEWAGAYPLSLPERKQNINCRIMRQLIFPVAKKAKRLGGKRHVLIQATLSTKLNGRTEWTVADAAVLFKEPVEDLVSDFAIEAISGGSEYRLRDNHAVDISRRELSAPAGSRTSVLNVQVLEDEHKSPLLKWDRVFPCPRPLRTEQNISCNIMLQLIFSVVCPSFRNRTSNTPSAADPSGR